jgi:hypothetical protein
LSDARLHLKGELADLKQQLMELEIVGKNHADEIKTLLSLSAARPIEKIDTQEILSRARQLHEAREKQAQLMTTIRRIARELE